MKNVTVKFFLPTLLILSIKAAFAQHPISQSYKTPPGGNIPINGKLDIDTTSAKLVDNVDYSLCCSTIVTYDKSKRVSQPVLNISADSQSYNYQFICYGQPDSSGHYCYEQYPAEKYSWYNQARH